MEERNRAYRRHHRRRVIRNKRRLITKVHGYEKGYDKFPVDGLLDKGRIHCSCSRRSKKVKKDGWKHSDLKQIARPNDVDEWEGLKLQYT